MRRILFVNQKGGVGKTSSAIHVAAALARLGQRTLFIDADPSMNASYVLAAGEYRHTLSDVLLGNTPINDAFGPTKEEGLFLLPSEARFANFVGRAREVNEAAPQLVMRQKLNDVTGFDFVVLDVPPTLDLTVVNALAFADEAWVPVEPDTFSLHGLYRLQEIIQALRQNFQGPTVAIRGIFLTKVIPHTLAVPQVLRHLASHFPNLVCRTTISRSVQVAYALGNRQTVFSYAPASKPAEQFMALTQEILTYEPAISRVR